MYFVEGNMRYIESTPMDKDESNHESYSFLKTYIIFVICFFVTALICIYRDMSPFGLMFVLATAAMHRSYKCGKHDSQKRVVSDDHPPKAPTDPDVLS